jgi:hypothetical protein
MLLLTMPQEAGPTNDADADPDADADAVDTTLHADDLKPFERGPEITEVR